jgi:hypothetical protein
MTEEEACKETENTWKEGRCQCKEAGKKWNSDTFECGNSWG